MRHFLSVISIIALLGSGCGDDGSAPGGFGGSGGSGGVAGSGVSGGSGGSPDGGDGVRGANIDHYLTEAAVVQRPVDLSGTTPTVLVGATMYTGTGAADGMFVVPGVPPGVTYALRNVAFPA